MWILENSTNLLSSLAHLEIRKATSIQTFDFSTLYTSIPYDLLKSLMNNIINNAFKHKNGATRYTHINVGRNKNYFTNDPLNGDNKYTASDICKMIEFLVGRLGLVDSFFERQLAFLWEQTVPYYWLTCFSIPMRTSFQINSLRRAKENLLESSISYIVILMILSLSIIKDLMNSSLISTPKNSPFLRLQNLLQLLLISTYFLLEMRTTTLPPNYMTNVMRLVSTL